MFRLPAGKDAAGMNEAAGGLKTQTAFKPTLDADGIHKLR